jgi:hypothetical protein
MPFEQHGAEHDLGTVPAVPRHRDVHRVAGAMRARQHRRVPERAQPQLMLDAAGQAGHPQRRGARRRERGELRGQLPEQLRHLGPGPGEPQPDLVGHPVRPYPPLQRAHRAAGQPAGLAPEPYTATAQIHQFVALLDVKVVVIRRRRAPPERVDLRQQADADEFGQIGRRPALIRLEFPYLGKHRTRGAVKSGRRGGEQLLEFGRMQSHLHNGPDLARVQIAASASPACADTTYQLTDGIPVGGKVECGCFHGRIR